MSNQDEVICVNCRRAIQGHDRNEAGACLAALGERANEQARALIAACKNSNIQAKTIATLRAEMTARKDEKMPEIKIARTARDALDRLTVRPDSGGEIPLYPETIVHPEERRAILDHIERAEKIEAALAECRDHANAVLMDPTYAKSRTAVLGQVLAIVQKAEKAIGGTDG